MTATRKQFARELAKHAGAAVDATCDEVDFHVDAPAGKVWAANGCHCLTANHANVFGQSYRGEAYADLIARMRCGLADCETPDCDICEERAAG
jgi:hypothetical protein